MEKIDLTVFPFWERLTKEEKELLQSQARIVRFEENQLIASTEIDCLGVLYIKSGMIRLYLYSEDGREVTIARLAEDDVCLLSASCMLSQVSFPAQVSAESPVEAILIPVNIISSIKEKNVYVENYVYRLTTERFSDVISAVEQMLFMTLEQRIVSFLLDETARTGGDTVHMTQEKLAQAIGSAREAVTRTLKQLSSAGVIEVFRGGIKIIDRKALYEKVS